MDIASSAKLRAITVNRILHNRWNIRKIACWFLCLLTHGQKQTKIKIMLTFGQNVSITKHVADNDDSRDLSLQL